MLAIKLSKKERAFIYHQVEEMIINASVSDKVITPDTMKGLRKLQEKVGKPFD